jgi:hypothetical protein
MPEESAYHQSVEYGNKIIIFGGLNYNQVFNDYLLLNKMSKVWYYFETYEQIDIKRGCFNTSYTLYFDSNQQRYFDIIRTLRVFRRRILRSQLQ